MPAPITIFSIAGYDKLARTLADHLNVRYSQADIHRFPDQECSIRIVPADVSPVCIIVKSLYHPDSASLPLLFLSEILREFGAEKILLVAPYLAYMRQDKRFREGEGITAKYYARLISQYFDGLLTVNPHLHRIQDLNDIYSIPSYVIHAAPVVADWIHENIENPLLIGPDSESEQWIRDLAGRINIPFVVLEKVRHSDRNVEVSVPDVEKWLRHKPVVFDDIISTGKTMIELINHLLRAGMQAPICIGVHGIFSDNAYHELIAAGADRVITTTTIPHESNIINIAPSISQGIKTIWQVDA